MSNCTSCGHEFNAHNWALGKGWPCPVEGCECNMPTDHASPCEAEWKWENAGKPATEAGGSSR